MSHEFPVKSGDCVIFLFLLAESMLETFSVQNDVAYSTYSRDCRAIVRFNLNQFYMLKRFILNSSNVENQVQKRSSKAGPRKFCYSLVFRETNVDVSVFFLRINPRGN